MMKAYPLIYSRTKFVDYLEDFLVRPENINVRAAAVYVNEALENVKYSDGLRHSVFSVGEYLIYGGTACMTQSIIDRILREKKIDKLDFDYEDYQADKADRPIVFFIGFAVRRNEIKTESVPYIDLYETYKIYLRYLKKQWLSATTASEVLKLNQNGAWIDIPEVEYVPQFKPDVTEYDGKKFIRNYKEDDYHTIINYYFYEMLHHPEQDFSFLSQVISDDVTSLHYKNISIFDKSVEECITLLKEQKNKPNIVRPEQTRKAPAKPIEQKNPKIVRVEDIEEKKTNPSLKMIIIVGLIIALVVCTIGFLASKLSKDKKSDNSVQEAEIEQILEDVQDLTDELGNSEEKQNSGQIILKKISEALDSLDKMDNLKQISKQVILEKISKVLDCLDKTNNLKQTPKQVILEEVSKVLDTLGKANNLEQSPKQVILEKISVALSNLDKSQQL